MVLQFIWPDPTVLTGIDKSRDFLDQINGTEQVLMPNIYTNERYTTLTGRTHLLFPRVQSIAKYFPAYPLWLSISFNVWNASLSLVNGRTSVVETYGPLEVGLGNPRRTGKITVELWKNNGAVFYAELRIDTLYISVIDPILPIEITQAQSLFTTLSKVPGVNASATADPGALLFAGFGNC